MSYAALALTRSDDCSAQCQRSALPCSLTASPSCTSSGDGFLPVHRIGRSAAGNEDGISRLETLEPARQKSPVTCASTSVVWYLGGSGSVSNVDLTALEVRVVISY